MGWSLRRRLLVGMTVVAAGVLPVAACGQAPSTSVAGPVEVRLAYQPGPASLPMEVAERTGILARNGLHLVRTEGNDLTVFTTAVAQGQYEVAMSVPTMVLVAAEKGLDVQIVSGLQRSSQANPNLAWVTRDASIASLEQLKGRKVAVPALVGQVADSFTFLLERRGVSRKDVTFVQAAMPAMADQLNAGRVDAALLPMSIAGPLARRNGFAVHDDIVAQAVHEASGGTVDSAITLVLVARHDYTGRHPEVITAFRRSLNEAIAYLAGHDAEARTTMQEWLKLTPEVAQAVVLPTWRVELDPEELAPYVTIARSAGTITQDPDVERLVWQAPR